MNYPTLRGRQNKSSLSQLKYHVKNKNYVSRTDLHFAILENLLIYHDEAHVDGFQAEMELFLSAACERRKAQLGDE